MSRGFFSLTMAIVALTVVFVFTTAGRPVFHDLSLDELVARSDLIALAVPVGSSRNGSKLEGYPYTSRFKIEKIIWSRNKDRSIALGANIEVLDAGYDVLLADRDSRIHGGSGFSYAAQRYKRVGRLPEIDSIRTDLTEFSKHRIIFAKHRNDAKYEFTASGAYEHPNQEAQVRQIIANLDTSKLDSK